MSSISNVTLLDNNNYKLKDSSIAFGTCSTGASTATKVVTIADTSFELRTGSIIGVKFTTSNTASSVKLNVNSSGAKSIYYNNAVYTGTSQNITGVANCIHYYMYDGTNWCFINYSGNYSTSDTYPSAYCGTAAGTAAKAATCTNYTLTSKSWLHVLIANANTSASALTLNVNSKGAKPIYINGAASSSSNYTLPAGSYLVYYDGTNYYFRTDGKLTGDITGNAATASTADYATSAGKIGSTDIGGTAKPVWVDDGTVKAISATAGSTTQPVYLNGGTISAMSGALSKTYGGTGNTTGTATLAETTANTSSTLYPVGVTSGETTNLLRDTSVTMKGGTVTATTFSGDLSGNASSAGKFNSSRTIQLTGDATGSATGDGSSGWSIATTVSNATTAGNVTGVIAIANGGTGKTTGKDAANVLLNSLDTGSSTPGDNDYYISQYVNGGTTTTTYHRRPMSAMWEWIKSKIAAWSKNLTAKGNLGWTSQANDKIPVTNNTLAYWDGRYNATQSNLTYCVKGAFGNLAVKDALTKSDVGLGNVDNTADASKSVASAVTATNDSGGNVIKDTYVKKTGDTMSGTLVISKTQDASGTANNSPALIVGGAATAAHMEIDANEIMAKSNGTSVATLFVNWDGGTTITGGNLETKGAVRVGATGDTAGGCVQQYNSTTQSLDFIFA